MSVGGVDSKQGDLHQQAALQGGVENSEAEVPAMGGALRDVRNQSQESSAGVTVEINRTHHESTDTIT